MPNPSIWTVQFLVSQSIIYEAIIQAAHNTETTNFSHRNGIHKVTASFPVQMTRYTNKASILYRHANILNCSFYQQVGIWCMDR